MVILSVVCPVLNEEHFIESVLKFFLSAEPVEKELYIIDGGSTDKTTSIIQQYAQNHNNIHLLNNPEKYVAYALNKAIPLCKGDYIVRLDAHTHYDPTYFQEIVKTFVKTKASIVGGPMRVVGVTPAQKAIAHATSTPFGIGNSDFHFDTIEGETDSVYLGAWKKSIFERTGLFDVKFVRNQDDEFHYRAKSLGFKIWLSPEIKSHYYPRNSISKLWSQYFQYGLFKPLVLSKIKSAVRLRHLIPSVFFINMLLVPLVVMASYTYSNLFLIGLLPLLIYLLLDLYYAAKCKQGVYTGTISLIVFPILHMSYGVGFLIGMLKLFKK
jgi:glycosyltransferase involved in cell wall biosynthesis